MSELIVWKNKEMDKMRRDVERLFNRMGLDFASYLMQDARAEGPTFDISETDDSLIVKVELPGVHPRDLQLSVTGTTLSLRGEKREENTTGDAHYRRVERHFGSFSRTIRLPCMVKVEETQATFEEGTLRIVMPKWRAKKAAGIKIRVE